MYSIVPVYKCKCCGSLKPKQGGVSSFQVKYQIPSNDYRIFSSETNNYVEIESTKLISARSTRFEKIIFAPCNVCKINNPTLVISIFEIVGLTCG